MNADYRDLWKSAGGLTPTNWDFALIEDLLENPKAISVGVMYPGTDTPGGIPLIKVSDVKDGTISKQPKFCINKEVDEEYKRTKLNGSELLITLVGNPGDCVIVTEEMVGWNAARALAVVRLKDPCLRPWLRYVLLSKPAKHLIEARLNTTVQKTLNLKDIKELSLPLPPKNERNFITEIIASIERKARLNSEINQTLEQIAQAIFKSWFVDFEPVKAKIAAKENGQDPERATIRTISGKSDAELNQLPADQLSQLTTTAALFPDELVDSELGMIPRGWGKTNLSAITSKLRRGVSPKYIEEGGVQVVNQKCIRNHTVDFSLCRRNDPIKRKIDGRELQVGDILVNSTGVGTLGRLAPIRYLPETTVADSHVTVVRGKKERVTTSFLTSVMLTKESFIESSGAGSTGQTELRRQALEEIGLCMPSYNIQAAFEKMVKPTHDHIAQNEQQQLSLTQLRDSLLPKLLSGEITVAETQAKIEAAV